MPGAIGYMMIVFSSINTAGDYRRRRA